MHYRICLVIFALTVLPLSSQAAADATKPLADVKQQYADALRRADSEADAKSAEAQKTMDAALDAATKSALKAGSLDAANQIAALRKTISNPAADIPAADSVASAEARRAIADFAVARKKISDDILARQASASSEYVAKLDQILKQAMQDGDLAEANQINAARQAAQLEAKLGPGRFPAGAVMVLTFDPDAVVSQGPRPRIIDQSGRGNDILLDAPVKFEPGPAGVSFRPPAGKPLHSTQLVGVSGHQPRTMAFWLNVEKMPEGELHSFLSWGSSGNGGEFGAMISNRHFTMWGWGTGFDFNTAETVELNAWHHHAIVYDGTTATWYVDGASIGSKRLNLDTVPAPLAMGGIDCRLRDVLIYDRALTPEEIGRLFHRQAFRAPTDAARPPEAVAVKPPEAAPANKPRRSKPGKQQNEPIAPSPVATEVPISGEFFSFAGQAGLPQYLKCEQQLVGGPDGVRWGTVRTIETDFTEKDFVLDVVFALNLNDPHRDAIVGIGDNDDRSNPLICHLGATADGGYAQMAGGRHETKRFADLKPDVPNLMRFEKKGDVLTVSITADFKGKYRADFSTTFPSVKSAAPQLNRLNSNLCFSGNALFESIRLEVEGKVADPGPTIGKFVELPANFGWTRFEPGAGLPPYLDGSSGVSIGKDGLELDGKGVRTKASDYLTKNFTLDVVYAYRADDNGEMRIGIGENGYDGGNWIVHSVTALMHGANRDGVVQYTFKDFYNAPLLGKLGKEHLGPNLLRFQKRGDTLLIAVCADYADQYKPDFMVIIPSLKWQAPYLNDKNSALFMGLGGTVQRMRLIVDGKAGEGEPAVANGANPANHPSTDPAAGKPGELVSVAGVAGVPAFVHASAETLADAKGLSGGEIHTTATDLIEHDFIFDLLFSQNVGEKAFGVHLGDNIGTDAVACRITDMGGADASFAINMPRQEWQHVGKIGASPGPHLLRIVKRGNTLTFSLCVDYKDNFKPEFVRTIPDLKSACPGLTRLNSALHVRGGVARAIGLSIDGVDQSKTGARTLDTAPVPPVTTAPNPQAAAPALPLAGPVGPENFMKLVGPKLPAYFETLHDLTFGADGLALKDVHLRTRDADLIDKDFIFDTVFHFNAARETMMIGLGADEREGNRNHKSIVCRIESPAGGGYARIVMDGAADATIGSFGANGGPHMLRIQKRGNTLTFALCLNYKGTFSADFIKTLPDLKGVAPALDAKNSAIFIGDGGVADQVRFIVSGEPTASHDIALNIPARCLEGAALHQQIFQKPNLHAALEQPAPAGMSLTPAGALNWTPAHDQVGLHEIKIKISGNGPDIVESANIEVVSAEDAKAVGGDLAKIDSLYRLAVESDKAKVVPGLGASLLLLDGQTLRQLGADGLSVIHTWKLPGKYEFIGERKNYLVALSDESKSLDLIDKATGKITRSIQMDYFRRHDLCLNPVQPISYVSVEKAAGGGGFVQAILIVDENSGDVREPNRFVGTFMKASADGTRLYTGYKDIYTRGHELLFNPDNIDVIPVYGNIDILMVYDISRPTQPVLIAAKNDAGGNGQGLAVSPDGKRVAYLSYVGYPLYSKNIAAWDPNDLTKRPVSYAAKENKADCRKLAFHPILPIVAIPSENGVVCFDRESGQVLPDRIDLRAALEGAKVHDVIFSPDGENLILLCEFQGDFFIRRFRLNLSAEEMDTVKKGPVAPAPAAPIETGTPHLRT